MDIPHLRRLIAISFLLALPCFLRGAPVDDLFEYRQPDGATFMARVVGDEFYADEETADGYRIVRDPTSGFWCYARLSKDGRAFESTGIQVGLGVPAGLAKHLRLSREEQMNIHAANRAKMGVDDRGQRLLPADFNLVDVPANGIDGGIMKSPPANPTVGARKGLTLLVQFPDRPEDATITRDQVDAYCNQMAPHYTGFGNNGSVAEYFYEVSDGTFTRELNLQVQP